MIVPVDSENERYDFLLDTGAPTVVSKELADKLNRPILAQQQVADSQQASEGMLFARLASLQVGGITFSDIGVAITDLNASTDITCLEIDGLLGANFLRNAEWKFDYIAQQISFSSSLDSFEIAKGSLEVPLGFTLTKTPVITVQLGKDVKEKRVAVDLGSNGGFSLKKETFVSLQEEIKDLSYTVEYGMTSGGLYNENRLDSTFTVDVSAVSFL